MSALEVNLTTSYQQYITNISTLNHETTEATYIPVTDTLVTDRISSAVNRIFTTVDSIVTSSSTLAANDTTGYDDVSTTGYTDGHRSKTDDTVTLWDCDECKFSLILGVCLFVVIFLTLSFLICYACKFWCQPPENITSEGCSSCCRKRKLQGIDNEALYMTDERSSKSNTYNLQKIRASEA